MSGESTAKPIEIPRELVLEIFRHARDAFPAECCGWLTGPADGDQVTGIRPTVNAQVAGDHPSGQGRSADEAYVIAGEDLLAFNRAFDDPTPPRIIYHSHPNGRAYFSNMDQEVARSPWGDGPAYPVQQLVVGLDSDRVDSAALFAWSDEDGKFVEIARLPGADDI
ncbi:MAG: Mov34/MPN/PAD-1 family protein [Proteobacteria bacterium]|nr:Mov34/MPN/PAD-1 family protein [Pseudomonadota bacterium]